MNMKKKVKEFENLPLIFSKDLSINYDYVTNSWIMLYENLRGEIALGYYDLILNRLRRIAYMWRAVDSALSHCNIDDYMPRRAFTCHRGERTGDVNLWFDHDLCCEFDVLLPLFTVVNDDVLHKLIKLLPDVYYIVYDDVNYCIHFSFIASGLCTYQDFSIIPCFQMS